MFAAYVLFVVKDGPDRMDCSSNNMKISWGEGGGDLKRN